MSMEDNPLSVPEMAGASIPAAVGIAAVALSMSLKYYDMTLVKDGSLYQQYKVEGRNIETIGLENVFEMAIKIERHLVLAEERVATLLIDALNADADQAALEGEG